MQNVTIYDSEYITVEYWPHKKLIYHKIHKPLGDHLEVFKEALNAGSAALEKYKLTKWLSDDRANDSLTEEGNEWTLKDWQPRTMKAGWKYWAGIVPQDVIAAGSLIPVMEIMFELGLRMMVFTDIEQAIAWLDKVESL